jgi:SAM-dependent methyltransferase
MYYLSREESDAWKELAARVLQDGDIDESIADGQPHRLKPAFCYYLASNLIGHGRSDDARKLLALGAQIEPIRANACLLDYLERHDGELKLVQPSFSDPRPWAHFSSLPHLKAARAVLCEFCASSLREFERPLRMMDIGCGNGALTVAVLESILSSGKAASVGKVLLLDPSAEMLAAAKNNVEKAFPEAEIKTLEGKLEEFSGDLPPGFDLALCALSVHHMPYELKKAHIGALSGAADSLVIFELGANHDTPECNSPELVYSVYQTFGQSLEYIFAREAPPEVQQACADIFVMSETISLLTGPRGERTEYHMPRRQWHDLLSSLATGMTCLGETTCYSDQYCELVALHYGR